MVVVRLLRRSRFINVYTFLGRIALWVPGIWHAERSNLPGLGISFMVWSCRFIVARLCSGASASAT